VEQAASVAVGDVDGVEGCCMLLRLGAVLRTPLAQGLSSLHSVHVLDTWGVLPLHCRCPVLCFVRLINDMMSLQTQMHGGMWVT
jgi:hypothetical protein